MDHLANAITGIQLAQSGKRAEALPYLRQAAQISSNNPEIWLWLAHVTPDIGEYHHCVQQALHLNPSHAIANQMNHALQRSSSNYNPPALPAPTPNPAYSMESRPLSVDAALVTSVELQQQSRKRRRLRFLLLSLNIALGIIAFLAISLGDNFLNRSDDDSRKQIAVEVPVGGESGVAFDLSIPATWELADIGSDSWLTVRDELLHEFPQSTTFWLQVQFNLATVTVTNEGNVQPVVSIVEVDKDAVERDSFNPARLQLVKISEGRIENTSCDGVEAFAEEQTSLLDNQENLIDSGVEVRSDDRCLFVEHYRDQSPLSNMVEHIYVIFVPFDDDSLAQWHLTVIEDSHDLYSEAIQQIINTLNVE